MRFSPKKQRSTCNMQMEINGSTLKTKLNKTNLSLQYIIIWKSKLDEIFGTQMMENKSQELGYVQKELMIKRIVAQTTFTVKKITKGLKPKICALTPLMSTTIRYGYTSNVYFVMLQISLYSHATFVEV